MKPSVPLEDTSTGFNNTDAPETVQGIKAMSGEYYISSKNNSFIRLGRDRYGGPHEGYGSLNKGGCGAIDLFCGAGPKGEHNLENFMNLNFNTDASRVYISQKANIDEYFSIVPGTEKHSSRGRSAIGIKSDHIRLLGRQHIKIVTGKAFAEGQGPGGETNSLGGRSDGGGRIDFITGNNTEPRKNPDGSTTPGLQPIPLGDNLRSLLVEMVDLITSLKSIVSYNTRHIEEVATSLCTHFHTNTPQPLPGMAIIDPAIVSKMLPVLGKSLSQATIGKELHDFNTKVINMKHLDKFAAEYILSTGVYTT